VSLETVRTRCRRAAAVPMATARGDACRIPWRPGSCTALLDSEMLFAGDTTIDLFIDKQQRLKGEAKLSKWSA
jgi:hypothetical protein